jgi:hypothetical protein
VLDLQITFEYVRVPLLLRFLYFEGNMACKCQNIHIVQCYRIQYHTNGHMILGNQALRKEMGPKKWIK